jgi:hypothetical protein
MEIMQPHSIMVVQEANITCYSNPKSNDKPNTPILMVKLLNTAYALTKPSLG